jgi:tetratricopeptide (TPR) repeat protein
LFEGWAFAPADANAADYPAQFAEHQARRSARYGYTVPAQPKENDMLVSWLIEKKRYPEALALAKNNLAQSPDDGDLAARVATISEELGKPAEALCFYRRAARRPGAYADYWASKAKIDALASRHLPPALCP